MADEPTGGFAAATAVRVDDHVPGRYHADIPAGWGSPVGVHGGVLAATITRGMQETGATAEKQLRSVSVTFLDRPSSGRLVIDTEVVRVGGLTTHVESRSRSHEQDATATRVSALFGRDRPGAGYLDATPPDVPPPDDCPTDGEMTGAPVRPPIFDHLDLRPALGALPWHAEWTPDQPARYARWNRYHVPPIDERGELDPLALLPIADLPAAAAWVRFGPTDPFVGAVSLELGFHLLEPPTEEWILTDFTARWMGDGYLLTEGDVWSGDRLVAFSSQLMLVRTAEQPMVVP
jgi:acyl-CoA thioesterase